MKQIIIMSSGVVALCLAVIAGISWYRHNYAPVNSFAECEKAGYRIVKSNPRICIAGSKRFSE